MNKKQLIIIFAFFVLLLFSANLFAQEADEDTQKSDRLDKVCELLQDKNLTNDRKAELLYEKSYIMLTTFWVSSLRTGTEILLKAIELAPQNKEYKDFLCDVYDNLWKDKDLSDGDEVSKELQALKERVKTKVESYRKGDE